MDIFDSFKLFKEFRKCYQTQIDKVSLKKEIYMLEDMHRVSI